MLTDLMVTETAAMVAAIAAGVAGLLYLARLAWGFFTSVQRIHELITHELTHNSGGSMKDNLTATAQAVGQLQADVAELARAKALAHELLQLQLDTLADALGLPVYDPTHKRPEL